MFKTQWYAVINRSDLKTSNMLLPYIVRYPNKKTALHELNRDDGLIYDLVSSPKYNSEECYLTKIPPRGIEINP